MRRLIFVMLVVAALAVPVAASASTTVTWKATFSENIGGPNHSPFVCPVTGPVLCSNGEVVGLGQAQDLVVFGNCGPNCDEVRTLTFADGSTIVMVETESNFRTPGKSQPSPPTSYGNPGTTDLGATIVGGTGRFAGASGTASGQALVAGGVAIVTLSGTVTF
jgi:hypothetical protein